MKIMITATAANGCRLLIDAAAVIEYRHATGTGAYIWAQVGRCEYRQFTAGSYSELKKIKSINTAKI